jgi:hypothetical protein
MAAITAADIYPTWLASVPRTQPVPPPASKDEIWDNTAHGHAGWWRNLTRKLFDNGLAPMASSTRRAYGMLDPAHKDDPAHVSHVAFAQEPVFGKDIDIPNGWLPATKTRAKQVNAERAAYVQQFRGRWCSAVIDRLDDATAQLILDPAQPDLLTDPDQLYEAIMRRVVGGTASEIGPRVFRDAQTIKWPTKGTDGAPLTMEQQVDQVINLYRAVAARFVAIDDKDYAMTAAAMVAAITMRAPNEFDTSAIALFEACTDLSALQAEMQKAARRIDERSPTGLSAFVTTATADQSSRLDRIEAALLTLAQAGGGGRRGGGGGGGGGGSGGGRRERATEERRFNEEAGPVNRGERFCTKHGWQRHSSERCYTLHPDLAPANWVHNVDRH